MATSHEETPDEEMVYTFTWKIENISLYKGEINTDLSSPSFKIGKTNPTEFQVYLNSGEWSTKDIRVRVLGSTDNLEGAYKEELTLLYADGKVIESYSKRIYLGCSCGFCLYPHPTLFSNEKVLLLFLPQNTLIIRWKVYGIGPGECFYRTVFHERIFRWNIRDFSKRSTFTKSFHLSSENLTIDLSKLQDNPFAKILMIKFIPSNQDRLLFGNCTIAAVDKEIIYRYGEVNILYRKITYEQQKKKYPPSSWEAPVMLDKGACKLIKNDKLILRWELIVGIDEIWNGKEPHTKGNVDRPRITEMSHDNLQSDLLRLYEDKKFCDATLKTGTFSFPVHKNVLCARSPVFCAMFEGDSEESRTSVVTIPDIEPDTLSRMLLFVYTDSIGDIPWEMAAGLYYAADKYHIQTLKEKSASVLMEGLTVSNACDALLLADTHQDEDLMRAVKDFVFDHDEVINSAQWKELEKKNPQLAVKILRDLYLMKKT